MPTKTLPILSALTAIGMVLSACTTTDHDSSASDPEVAETVDSPPTQAPQVTSDVRSTSTTASEDKLEPASPGDPFSVNQGLSRTLNIGAVYEVAKGDTWGNDFAPSDLAGIAAQGFTAVRVPIKWSDWTAPTPPFGIDEAIFEQIDAVVEEALNNGLSIVLDVHHYEELDADPEGEADRFLAIWGQIAVRYQDEPSSVVFELSNEPHDQFSGPILNDLLAEAVPIIRRSNPSRTIMVGPDQWYSPLQLDTFELPDDDNLIVTMHYYEPFPFTHQGASWVDDSDTWTGTTFADPQDRLVIEEEFALVADWADQNQVPIFVGEFGALDGANREDRLAWTRFVRDRSEQYGFSWAYWDWATPGFGLYSHATGEWDTGLLDALLEP